MMIAKLAKHTTSEGGSGISTPCPRWVMTMFKHPQKSASMEPREEKRKQHLGIVKL